MLEKEARISIHSANRVISLDRAGLSEMPQHFLSNCSLYYQHENAGLADTLWDFFRIVATLFTSTESD